MTRRRSSTVEVSLLPFLSVLCAMIGVLVLFLLLTLSTRAMEASSDVPKPEPPPLPPREDAGESLSAEEYQRLTGQIDQLSVVLNQRRQEATDLARLQAELLDLIDSKESQLKRAKSYGLLPGVELEPKQDVLLRPDKNHQVRKKPRFLEVTATEFILQPDETHFPLGDLEREDSPLQKFLQEMKNNRGKAYLLLLIHPAGSQSYAALRAYLEKNYQQVNIGYEPYSAGWVLVSKEITKK